MGRRWGGIVCGRVHQLPGTACKWEANFEMPTSISQKELRRLVDEREAQVVEVLSRNQYEREHIAGAINIPLKELTPEAIDELDRQRPVVVYCNDFL